MASSDDSEQFKTPGPIDTASANATQEQLLDDQENASQSAQSNARRIPSNFDNLILSNSVNNPANALLENHCVSSQQSQDGTVPSGSSIGTAISFEQISPDVNNATATMTSTAINQSQVQILTTIDNNSLVRTTLAQHIMISYHHDSSSDICQQISTELKNRGYKVWLDTNDLHGSIHRGMAEAVENSFIVLFCMNRQYYQSEFCEKEVKYTDKRHIKFIPCLMEKEYQPEGWLGIIIGDQLYIDFSSPDNFDTAIKELIAEIESIQNRTQISSVDNLQSTTVTSTLTTDAFTNNRAQYDSLTAVIRNFRESIQQNNHDTESMTEEEFSQFVNYLHQRIFGNTTRLPQIRHNGAREILEEILQHSRNQTEFLRRITEMLSNLTEIGPIIKLTLLLSLAWTIKRFLT